MPRYQSLVLAVILTLLGFQAGAREDTRLDTGWRFNLADDAGAAGHRGYESERGRTVRDGGVWIWISG